MLLIGLPILPRDVKRGPHALAHALDLGSRLVRLHADDGRHATLQDAGLLMRDEAQRIAQILLVVVVDGGDDRHGGINDIRCIEPAAEAHLEDEVISRRAAVGEEGGRGGDFEEGDRKTAVHLFAFLQQCGEVCL